MNPAENKDDRAVWLVAITGGTQHPAASTCGYLLYADDRHHAIDIALTAHTRAHGPAGAAPYDIEYAAPAAPGDECPYFYTDLRSAQTARLVSPQGQAAVPGIPLSLLHRPTLGGLVVPWFTARLPDGRYRFGKLDASRAEAALWRRWCQICGKPLEHPLVFLMRARDLARMISAEAACHVWCARYSVAACPMLAGAMNTYQHTSAADPLAGIGLSLGDPHGQRSAHDAEPWNLVYARDYTVIIDSAVGLPGARLTDSQIIRIRPIGTARGNQPGLHRTVSVR